MNEAKNRKDLLIKIRDERMELLIRNEIDVIYFRAEDKYVNTSDAKKQARQSREEAVENVRKLKKAISIVDNFLSEIKE